jgi:hypothetical protein
LFFPKFCCNVPENARFQRLFPLSMIRTSGYKYFRAKDRQRINTNWPLGQFAARNSAQRMLKFLGKQISRCNFASERL